MSEGETPLLMAPGLIHAGIIIISAQEDILTVSTAGEDFKAEVLSWCTE